MTGATIRCCSCIISMRSRARSPLRSGLPGETGKLLVNLLTEDHSRADQRGRHTPVDRSLRLSLVSRRRARLSAQAQRHRYRCERQGGASGVRCRSPGSRLGSGERIRATGLVPYRQGISQKRWPRFGTLGWSFRWRHRFCGRCRASVFSRVVAGAQSSNRDREK